MSRYCIRTKKAIVELYHLDRSVEYLSQEFSIPKATIRRWIREHQAKELRITITISKK